MLRPTLALAALLLLPFAAKADTFNYAITGSGGGFSGSGTLTAFSQGGGSYLVTAITGTGVTGLIAPNSPDFGNDNLLFPTSSRLFDVNGVAFFGTFGRVNLFSTVAGYEVQGFDPTGSYFDTPVSLAFSPAAATPEPSSVALSISGLFAGAMLLLRKRLGTLPAQTAL